MNEWMNEWMKWACKRFCAGQFNEATDDVSHALEFLKETYADDLDGYDGDSVQYIVAVLRERYGRYPYNASSAQHLHNDDRRRWTASTQIHRNNDDNNNNNNNDSLLILSLSSFADTDAGDLRRHSVTTATPNVAMGDDGVPGFFDAAHDVVEEYANVGWTADVFSGAIPINSSGPETRSNNRSSVPPPSYFENNSYAERLLEIAHIFHFVSIAILGIFVIQVGAMIVQVKHTWTRHGTDSQAVVRSTRWTIKTCHFVFDYNSGVSWSIF